MDKPIFDMEMEEESDFLFEYEEEFDFSLKGLGINYIFDKEFEE